MSCSRRYSGDSSLPPSLPLFPLPFSLFPSSRFCPRCPVRATSAGASPSFDISYFVISAFSVVLCARVLRAHLSLRLSLRPFLRHCMPACLYVHSAGCHPAAPSSIMPVAIRHLLYLACSFFRLACSFFRLACSLFFFVLFGPSPRCPARVHVVLCARVPRAVLSPPSVGSRHRRISRSYPRSSRVFLPASRPANTRRPARYASNAGVSLCRLRAVYLRYHPSLNMPIPA